MWGDDDRRVTYQVSYQPVEYHVQPPPSGIFKFSEEEKKHLLLAIGALTLAFTLIFMDGDIPIYTVIALSFVAVITAFLLHEMGHKVIAQRYGCWAEFRAWPMGLMLAVLSGFMGFLFAAPGAVYIRGNITKEYNGKISAAGPVMNIMVASFILPVLFLFPLSNEIFVLLYMICFLNVFIGGFNMIPFPPLDGSKIIKWNPGVWILLLLILGTYFVILRAPGLIFDLF